METIRYLRALTRSWWLVLLAVIAGGAGGYLVYHQTTPLYASSTRLVVGVNALNTDPVSGSALTVAVAGNMAQVMGTGPAVQQVYKDAGLGTVGYDSLSASTSNSFVTVRVTAANPADAYRVAQAYADPDRFKNVYQSIAGGSAAQYKLTVVSLPFQATDPYAPSLTNDLGIGLGAGLVLGLVIALLRESLNRTVRDSDALRDLTGLTIYGTVPLDAKRKLLPARTDPRSARAEAYRQIRTSLLSRTTARPLVIGITSATLGEGKTSVSTNTAAIFSRAGHRVVVIDADLRRPRVHTFFGLRPTTGLSDVLVGRTSLEDAIVSLDDGNLGVLPAGPIPPDPAELIGSEAMVQVLHELVQTYEFVIVDTPPVLPVTDALVIGPLVDGLLFVTKLQGTTDDRIVKALQAIERVNANVLGIIPNQAAIGGDRAYGYAYAYRPGRNERPHEDGRTSVPVPADPAMFEPLDDSPRGRRHQIREDGAFPAPASSVSTQAPPAAARAQAPVQPVAAPVAPAEPPVPAQAPVVEPPVAPAEAAVVPAEAPVVEPAGAAVVEPAGAAVVEPVVPADQQTIAAEPPVVSAELPVVEPVVPAEPPVAQAEQPAETPVVPAETSAVQSETPAVAAEDLAVPADTVDGSPPVAFTPSDASSEPTSEPPADRTEARASSGSGSGRHSGQARSRNGGRRSGSQGRRRR